MLSTTTGTQRAIAVVTLDWRQTLLPFGAIRHCPWAIRAAALAPACGQATRHPRMSPPSRCASVSASAAGSPWTIGGYSGKAMTQVPFLVSIGDIKDNASGDFEPQFQRFSIYNLILSDAA